MKRRINYAAVSGVYDAMDSLDKYLESASIEPTILHLVRLYASQMNGCAYCIDMHWKDLRALGESEQRLYSLSAWRECPYYSARERAALEWTEAITHITDGHAPDDAFEAVKLQFNETEVADLTLAIAAINTWNRLSIAARPVPGGYKATAAVA